MSQTQPPTDPAPMEPSSVRKRVTSKRVSDHLANERTFLAWIRTGLATITFGFVVQRFGLLLRQLGVKSTLISSLHSSTVLGVGLTLLGIIMMVVALINFLQNRREIEQDTFYPRVSFSILLTILACLIGLLLAFYLAYTG